MVPAKIYNSFGSAKEWNTRRSKSAKPGMSAYCSHMKDTFWSPPTMAWSRGQTHGVNMTLYEAAV